MTDTFSYWNYDIYSRVSNKVDNLNTVIFIYAYDADNRLTNRWTPEKGNTAYGYDAVGNLLTINYQLSPTKKGSVKTIDTRALCL